MKWAFSRRNEIRCPVCRAWAKNDEIYVVSTTVEGLINSKVKVCMYVLYVHVYVHTCGGLGVPVFMP